MEYHSRPLVQPYVGISSNASCLFLLDLLPLTKLFWPLRMFHNIHYEGAIELIIAPVDFKTYYVLGDIP